MKRSQSIVFPRTNMRHLVLSVIFFLAVPFSVFAVSQPSGISAVVAKAQFETSQISIQESEGVYQLAVDLVNSGDLEAQSVSVFVLYPDTMSYLQALQSAGTIITHGSSLGQFVEWQLAPVDAKESNELVLTFESSDAMLLMTERSFSVSIVSPVSVPLIKKVTIGADSDTFNKDPDPFQRFLNACYIRYVSFKRWMVQKFSGGSE